MVKSNFREWTLDKIDDTFGLEMVRQLPVLDKLLSFEYELDDYEKRFLNELRETYFLGGDDWNEAELENKIISPLFVFSKIDNRKFVYFLERELSVVIDDYELSGKVDGMIATGFRNPKKPFFCMNEYKRATDPNGDPKGQALIAMLVAQKLNDNKKPILGCFIVGRHWCFMALVDKKYAISHSFACDDDEIYDIYRILKSLRYQIDILAS
ncbi:MAG: hypothetical protein JNL70_07545 [Saprospiraceae bacterium]|nr:hypothetical protein [Saprospiraceae bacterium]